MARIRRSTAIWRETAVSGRQLANARLVLIDVVANRAFQKCTCQYMLGMISRTDCSWAKTAIDWIFEAARKSFFLAMQDIFSRKKSRG
jgi:hypothetical protein